MQIAHDLETCHSSTNRDVCNNCLEIITGSRENEQGGEGDPDWQYDVECCFGCGEEVGDDNDLPFVEKDGVYYCENCDSDADYDTAGSGEE